MKKGILSILILGLVLIISVSAFAGINQEFRGLSWGNPPTRDMVVMTMKDLEVAMYTFEPFTGANELLVFQGESLEDNYITAYTKFNEHLYMGEVPLSSIVYMFYDNQFMETRLYFNGKENYDALIPLCREKFGTLVLDYRKPRWTLWETTIEIFYDKAKDEGYMQIQENYTVEGWRRRVTKERKKLAKIAVKKTDGDW